MLLPSKNKVGCEVPLRLLYRAPPHRYAAVCGSRSPHPNLLRLPPVERARQEHLDAVVHLQMSLGSLFAGGPTDCFDRSPSSCKVPPTDRYDKQAQNHNR